MGEEERGGRVTCKASACVRIELHGRKRGSRHGLPHRVTATLATPSHSQSQAALDPAWEESRMGCRRWREGGYSTVQRYSGMAGICRNSAAADDWRRCSCMRSCGGSSTLLGNWIRLRPSPPDVLLYSLHAVLWDMRVCHRHRRRHPLAVVARSHAASIRRGAVRACNELPVARPTRMASSRRHQTATGPCEPRPTALNESGLQYSILPRLPSSSW